MIYMVDHVFTDPAQEPAWHDWYAGYLQKLLSVPGIHSTQRFKAIAHTPSRFLAMYSIDSADVYTSEGYKNIGGGGSQSAKFHPCYRLWTRNLFAGAERAPLVREGQRVLAADFADGLARKSLGEQLGALASRTLWLNTVGLHMTTPYRAIVVLNAGESAPAISGGFVYDPFTPPSEKP
jgi:hypothetical protein